jgi:3-dehydroquinate synthase
MERAYRIGGPPRQSGRAAWRMGSVNRGVPVFPPVLLPLDAMASEQSIAVGLSGRAYEVRVGEDILCEVGSEAVARDLGGQCAILTDENVEALHLDVVVESLHAAGVVTHVVVLPPGEGTKSFAHLEGTLRTMVRSGLDRHCFVVALGGGVIGDLGGLVASLFYRGVPCLQVPTTVVSQVDSSVGGKTAIDVPEGKNLVGAFHQPAFVLADTLTLRTLPPRAWAEGFAEIIKHAAIRDPDMLAVVDGLEGRDDLVSLISRNVSIKAKVVEEDELETAGVRAHLNFGHTLGHAIETAAGEGALLHGEAISLGLRAALILSERKCGLSANDTARVLSSLHRFDLPLVMEPGLRDEAILETMARDKKFEAGQMRFVLLSALGSAEVNGEVSLSDVRETLDTLRQPWER